MVQPIHRPQQQSHGTTTPCQPGSSTLNPDTTRHPDTNNMHQPTTKKEKRHKTRATSIQKRKFKQTKRGPPGPAQQRSAHTITLIRPQGAPNSQRNAEHLKRFSPQETSGRATSDIPRGKRKLMTQLGNNPGSANLTLTRFCHLTVAKQIEDTP